MSNGRAPGASEAKLRRRDVALLLLATAPLFVGLGVGLEGSEGRWLFVSQEMLRSGNWLEPRILGEFYGDKPLLSYWLIAVLATPLGVVNETLARLPSAFAAAGVAWLTARCAAPLAGRWQAVLAGLVVASAFSLVFWARSASADLVSLFFATAAIAVYQEATRHARPWHAPLFFALLALGGHAKGMPAVVVPLAVAGVDALSSRRLAAFAARWRGLLLGAALGAALYLAPFAASRVARGDWELLRLVWIENFVRAFAGFDHTDSVFYYVYTLPAMLMPWGLWLPGALLSASARRDRDAGERFALVAFAVIFALFTVSASRRSYYILPIFPWAALLIAAYWDRLASAREARGESSRLEIGFGLLPAGLVGSLVCAAGVLLVLGRGLPGPLRELVTALPGAPAIGLAALAIGAWLLRALARGQLRRVAAALAAAALLLSVVYATSLGAQLDDRRLERSFAAQVKERFPGRPVVYYGGSGLNLVWYLGPGEIAGSAAQLAEMLDASGTEDLLVVCGKAGPQCLAGAPGLRSEAVIERWTPALGRFLPARHRFTLLRVERLRQAWSAWDRDAPVSSAPRSPGERR